MAYGQVKVAYAEDLARRVCSCTSCDGVAIEQDCHPRAGVVVEFERSSALLGFFCRVCGTQVGPPVVVARDPQAGN